MSTNLTNIFVKDSLIYGIDNGKIIQVWNATNGNYITSYNSQFLVDQNNYLLDISVIGHYLFAIATKNVVTRYDTRNGSFVSNSLAYTNFTGLYTDRYVNGDELVFLGAQENTSGYNTSYLYVFGANNFTMIGNHWPLGMQGSVGSITEFEGWIFTGEIDIQSGFHLMQYRYFDLKLVNIFEGHVGSVNSLISLGGYLFSASDDSTIMKWDISTTGDVAYKSPITTFQVDGSPVKQITVTSGGFLVARTLHSGCAYVIDAGTGNVIHYICRMLDETSSIFVDQKQGILYVSFTSGAIQKWNTTSC